jgi:hypothetical protein
VSTGNYTQIISAFFDICSTVIPVFDSLIFWLSSSLGSFIEVGKCLLSLELLVCEKLQLLSQIVSRTRALHRKIKVIGAPSAN